MTAFSFETREARRHVACGRTAVRPFRHNSENGVMSSNDHSRSTVPPEAAALS
jgi:hypothetical protein